MKSLKKLNELDILDLLGDYKSELKKLKYKTDSVKFRISELEEQLKVKREEMRIKGVRTGEVVKRRGRPPKIESVKQVRKPYPLSDWDRFILDGIKDAGKVLINQEIMDNMIKGAKEKGIFQDLNDIKIKLNQHLVKLANRRGDLVKVRFKGRGHAYAMKEWMDGKKLMAEYKR